MRMLLLFCGFVLILIAFFYYSNTIFYQASILFTHVPSHIYHIIFEILKNSCRATTETHRGEDLLPAVKTGHKSRSKVNLACHLPSPSLHPPPHISQQQIKAILVKGEEDMTIKVGYCSRILWESCCCEGHERGKTKSGSFSCSHASCQKCNLLRLAWICTTWPGCG